MILLLCVQPFPSILLANTDNSVMYFKLLSLALLAHEASAFPFVADLTGFDKAALNAGSLDKRQVFGGAVSGLAPFRLELDLVADHYRQHVRTIRGTRV